MFPTHRTILLAVFLATRVGRAAAQTLPAPDDSRHSLLRQAMLGVLSQPTSIPGIEAQRRCLDLPVDPPNDRLQGPHGGSLLSARCEVATFEPVGRASPVRWTTSKYRWISVFTAANTARGSSARDTVAEEEVVLFEAMPAEQIRAVWHARFETGDNAIWRSITPKIAPAKGGMTLLSVMSCVNGTGGCTQEFIQRHPDGRWFPVWQVWLDQLPAGFANRIRHGFLIDPRTLLGSAGFYSERDPNCCPSQELRVRLAVRRDTLLLRAHFVRPAAH
jgi:hypothetical protein